MGDAARPGGLQRERPLPGAALGGGGTGRIRVSLSRSGSRRELEGVHRRAGPLSRPRRRISFMPTWTAISDIRPRACFRSARISTATCRWTARAATTNGTASFLSINCRRLYNPARGWIVTANQNPFPENYPYRVSGEFGAPYRSREIRDRLIARTGWKPEDMLAVEKDVYSGFSSFLAAQIVAAYDRKKPTKPELADAVKLLRSWNGQMEKQTRGAAADHAGLRSIAQRGGARGLARAADTDIYEPYMAPVAIQRIIESGGRGFFRDQDDALLQALAAAIEEGRRDARQRSGEMGLRPLQSALDQTSGRQPGAGGGKLLQYRAGGDERVVHHHQADFAAAGAVHAIRRGSGALGRVVEQHRYWRVRADSSRHYKDQWDAYYVGRSFPMQFEKLEAKRHVDRPAYAIVGSGICCFARAFLRCIFSRIAAM